MSKDEAHLVVLELKKKYLDYVKSKGYDSDSKAMEKAIAKAQKAWMKLVVAELKDDSKKAG